MFTLFFAAMILLHGLFLWHARRNIAIGRSDFISFYTAAEIVHQEHKGQLYDLHEQEAVQRSVAPEGIAERGALLPYIHPPFEVWVFLPFARLTYLHAYLAWFATNCVLLLVAILLLRLNLPTLGKEPSVLWIMAALSFTPIFMALLQGQDSILLLLCVTLTFVALRRKREFLAGASLALGLFKFQFVLPILIPFLFLKRWKLAAGFFCVAVVLLLIGVGISGWRGVTDYPLFLWATNRDAKLNSLIGSDQTLNLNGFMSALIPLRHSQLRTTAILISSALALASVCVFVRKVRRSESGFHLAFAATIIMAVLVSYHSWLHDLSILFVAVALVSQVVLSALHEIRYHFLLWISIAALFCAPIYLLQLLRLRGVPVVEIAILIFLFGILKQHLPDATWNHAKRRPTA